MGSLKTHSQAITLEKNLQKFYYPIPRIEIIETNKIKNQFYDFSTNKSQLDLNFLQLISVFD